VPVPVRCAMIRLLVQSECACVLQHYTTGSCVVIGPSHLHLTLTVIAALSRCHSPSATPSPLSFLFLLTPSHTLVPSTTPRVYSVTHHHHSHYPHSDHPFGTIPHPFFLSPSRHLPPFLYQRSPIHPSYVLHGFHAEVTPPCAVFIPFLPIPPPYHLLPPPSYGIIHPLTFPIHPSPSPALDCISPSSPLPHSWTLEDFMGGCHKRM
jgi:hypothetical protein